MLIHYILLFIVFFLSLLFRIKRDKKMDNKTNNVLLIIVFAIMFLFIGLRTSKIGTDTRYYVSWFLNDEYSFSSIEIMLPLISKIIHFFCNKYFVFLIILSFISIYGIYDNAKNYKFDTEYFLFLYITSFCYIYSSSAIRFFCAFSIILYSLKYMIKKDTIKVLLLVLFASLFHMSALIFLPVYFLTKFKFTQFNMIFYCLIMFGFLLLEQIFGLDGIFNNSFLSNYGYVLSAKNDIGGFSFLMNIGILFFSLIYYNSIKIYKEDYEFFIKVHIFSIVLDFISIASRLIWFFKFPIWFILPIIFVNIKKEKKKDYLLLYLIFLIIYLIYYYYYLKTSLPFHNYTNYEFNFNFD